MYFIKMVFVEAVVITVNVVSTAHCYQSASNI